MNLKIAGPKKTIDLEVSLDTTLDELKALVIEELQAKDVQVKIMFGGSILSENVKLTDKGIKDGDQLKVMFTKKPGVKNCSIKQ